MVRRFPVISTKKLTKSVTILTYDKSIVGVSDYSLFYKTAKRHMLTQILGPNAQVCAAKETSNFDCMCLFLINFKQKRNRIYRDTLINNTSDQLHALFKNCPLRAINYRELFQLVLFGLPINK